MSVKSRTIANSCTGYNKLAFPNFTPEHENSDKKPTCTNNIIILIDVSGSTNNDGSCTTRNSRCPQIDDESSSSDPDSQAVPPKAHTKKIIAAEVEGVANLLMQYLKRYNMRCERIDIIVFSSRYHLVTDLSIQTNKDIYDNLICKLGELPYECGGTNLASPLEFILTTRLDPARITDIILATDGQPQDKERTIGLLTKNHKCPFNLFIVGAGSIRESAGMGRCTSFFGTNCQLFPSRDSENPTEANRLAVGNSYSECDKEYLIKLSSLPASMISMYCGAYQDYEDLIDGANQYIDMQLAATTFDKVNYKVKLDKGMGDIDSNIKNALSNGLCVFSKTQYGSYLYTNQWQMRIQDQTDLPEFLCAKEFVSTNGIITNETDFTTIVKLPSNRNEIIIKFGDHELIPDLIPGDKKWFRIRVVSKIVN